MFYILIITVYVNLIYMHEFDQKLHTGSTIALGVGILYPMIYETIQLYQDGPCEYIKDIWNWIDVAYYSFNLCNLVLQFTHGPMNFVTKLAMISMVALLILKTFFFLRIFRNFTPIVIMLKNVIYDFRIFLLLYIILIFIISLVFNVIGVNLSHVQDDLIAYTAANESRRRRNLKMDKFEAMS